MAIDKLINSSQGDSIISLLGGGSGATSIADSLATIAAKSNTPYNTDNKLHAQYTDLPGYVKESSSKSIQTTDTVTDALGKLEYKVDKNISDIDINKNNILYNANQGVKNIFDFDSWYNSLTGATRATITATTNGITLTATGNDSYTMPQINGYHIPVKPNTSYTVTLDSSDSNGQLVFLENDGFSKVYVCETGTKTLTFTTSATADRLSVRFGVPTSGNTSTITNIMVQLASISDTTYQPYALSNAELTQSLLPTSYSSPTLIDDTTCTINEGGYVTVGNIVVINVTFTTTASYAAYGSIMQFPVPKNSGSITMVAAAHIDSSVNVAVNKYGQIALFDTPLPAGTYHFFTVYLKQ